MRNIFRTRYRIATDAYAGYEIQVWRWYLPFWLMAEVNGAITFASVEQAERCIERHRQRRIVKYID